MEGRPLDPKGGIRPIAAPERGAGAAGSGQAPRGAERQSPAFHVLLDKLQRSARELQENAATVERPSDLAGAVGRAKASLDDALDLGDRLLEAWRAERMHLQPPEPTESPELPGPPGPNR